MGTDYMDCYVYRRLDDPEVRVIRDSRWPNDSHPFLGADGFRCASMQLTGGASLTVADVKADPDFWLGDGPGREIARTTDCAHGYRLTDSCPNC